MMVMHRYNLACASLGGAGMVWVMTSEDDGDDDGGGGDPAAGGGDGIDTPSVLPSGLRRALGGENIKCCCHVCGCNVVKRALFEYKKIAGNREVS